MKAKKHIAFFEQAPLDSPPATLEQAQRNADGYSSTIQKFWRLYGRRIWDVQVRGFVVKGDQYTGSTVWMGGDIGKFMREVGTGDFVRNYTHIHGGSSAGRCGEGRLGGNIAVTFEGTSCGVSTSLHEIGHNNWLHHNSLEDGGEYNGNDSIMSGLPNIIGLNSVDMKILGFVQDREEIFIEENTQVLLAPIELDIDSLHDTEHKHAVIRIQSRIFHVSIRKVKGWPYKLTANGGAMLYVHEHTPDGHSIRQKPFQRYPGSTMTLNGVDVDIEYLEYSNETARVNIILDHSAPKPTNIPIPTKLSESTGTLEDKHSGAYFNRDFNGQGLDVHVKNGKALLYWYTFNESDDRDNSRRFYYAYDTVENMMKETSLHTTEGGTWADPTKAESVEAGTCQLSFAGGEAVFKWNTDSRGRGSTRMEKVFTASNHENNGSYFQKARSGEGITLQLFDTLDGRKACIAYWYSYGPAPRGSIAGGNYRGNTTQRWYYCMGFKDTDGTYELKVYEVYDHSWMDLNDDSGAVEVGTASIELTDKDNIKFSYDIKTPTVEGGAIRGLTRIF